MAWAGLLHRVGNAQLLLLAHVGDVHGMVHVGDAGQSLLIAAAL